MPSIAELIAQNLPYYRQARNLSQKELAILIGVKRNTIARWESGKGGAKLANLAKLAEILKIEESDLVYPHGVVPRVITAISTHSPQDCLKAVVELAKDGIEILKKKESSPFD